MSSLNMLYADVICELYKLCIFDRKPLEIKSCKGGFHGSDNRFPNMQVRFKLLLALIFSSLSFQMLCLLGVQVCLLVCLTDLRSVILFHLQFKK